MHPINEAFWDRKAAELTIKREALDRAKSLLSDAEDLANEGILKSDCFGLFGSRSDGLTAARVLAGMESGTAYGKIQFVYNPNDTSVATTRPTISQVVTVSFCRMGMVTSRVKESASAGMHGRQR